MVNGISCTGTNLSNAIQQFETASARLSQAATPQQSVVSPEGDRLDLSAEAVNLLAASGQVSVLASALRVQSDLVGELIDVLA